MRLLKRFCVLILGLAMPLAMSSVVRADAVTDWNAIAVQTIVNAGPTHGSAVGFLDNATVQIAVYDAVEAIDGRFKPYTCTSPERRAHQAAAAARPRTMCSSTASLPKRRPWTRPTTLIWQPTVFRRATPASPLARRQRRVSLLSGQMTGASIQSTALHGWHRSRRVAPDAFIPPRTTSNSLCRASAVARECHSFT